MAGIIFTPEELTRIENAVKDAESKTAGEIATAFIKESDDYAVYELLFSMLGGFIYFTVIAFFADSVEHIIRGMSWDYSAQYLVVFYGFSTFLVTALLYLAANLPFIDRLVVPKKVMWAKVNQRAVRQFMEYGVYNTRDRTGILIFISALERRVELLADTGISEKIPQQKWNAIVGNIIDGFKIGRLTDHIVESIHRCGELLAEHYPIQPDDVNELKDGLTILEK